MGTNGHASRDLLRLIDAIRGRRTSLIQVHNNPDPDAIGAAMGMRELYVRYLGIGSRIVFGGIVGRAENRAMLRLLGVEILPLQKADYDQCDLLTLVDTQPGFGHTPLPKGRVRVSKQDPADGSLEFIGEDAIDHTPKNEEVLIKLGSAFDVVGERKQTDIQVNMGGHVISESFEIRLRNHKDEAVKVIVKENLYRWVNWELTRRSHEFEKVDSRTIHFPVTVAPDDEVVIEYTVRYTW